MSEFPLAADARIQHIPLVGVFVILGLMAFFVWDALRLPAGLWFRWLMPLGFIPLLAGIVLHWIWLIPIGAVVMAAGLGLGKNWRQNEARSRW
ncbi:hypothetical protein [Streptomyces sp. NPDC056670]|uniref:hypothetical protein n=1 Tax=Streptomyces sp. NPDC056670 TaxID=3345904 RepID=UPI0036820F02